MKDDNAIKEDFSVEGDSPEVEDEVAADFHIASYPSDLTLGVLQDMWDNGDIIIPDYQRNFVWSIKQASLLIESFLIGLPVPQVFFYVNEENRNEVIDGQQRITSIVYFLSGYFGDESIHGKKQVFRLSGLSENSKYNKKRFDDLEEPDKRKLRNSSVLRAINIKQLSPRDDRTSAYHIFERLNTGGSPLKAQEIRNVVFRGDFLNQLKELNLHGAWRSLIGKSNLDRYQKDVELVLRIFAFCYREKAYEKPMKEFLNKACNDFRDESSNEVADFSSRFVKVCDFLEKELGDKPFHIRGPLNIPVLESVFVTVFNNFGKVEDVKNRLGQLLDDDGFDETTYLSTSDASVIRKRFKLAKNALVDK